MIERELPINKTIPKENSDDFKRILALVSKNGMLYLHKNNGLKEDREIFKASVLNTPWIIQHIPENLKDDEELFRSFINYYKMNSHYLAKHEMTISDFPRFASKRLKQIFNYN